MDCFKVTVPDGKRLHGHTATGQLVPVHPGEYLVHRLRPKGAATAPPILRLVGADAMGRDVHVRWDAVSAFDPVPEDATDTGDPPSGQRPLAGNDESFQLEHDDRTRSPANAR
jgi:hypothetical protein